MKRASLLPVFLFALIFVPPLAWAQPSRSDYYGPHMMWEGGWLFLGPMMMFAFIAVIVVVVLLVLRAYGGPKSGGRTAVEGKAEEILKERFARGDIDKEEYEERRRILRD